MESTVNFFELFAQAKETGDRRLVVFNQLIKKVKTDILPKMAKAVNDLGYNSTYIKTYSPVLENQEPSTGNPREEFPCYYTKIDSETGTIGHGKTEWDGYDGIDIIWDDSMPKMEFSDAALLRVGIVEFTEKMQISLQKTIQKREEQTKKAEILLGE